MKVVQNVGFHGLRYTIEHKGHEVLNSKHTNTKQCNTISECNIEPVNHYQYCSVNHYQWADSISWKSAIHTGKYGLLKFDWLFLLCEHRSSTTTSNCTSQDTGNRVNRANAWMPSLAHNLGKVWQISNFLSSAWSGDETHHIFCKSDDWSGPSIPHFRFLVQAVLEMLTYICCSTPIYRRFGMHPKNVVVIVRIRLVKIGPLHHKI